MLCRQLGLALARSIDRQEKTAPARLHMDVSQGVRPMIGATEKPLREILVEALGASHLNDLSKARKQLEPIGLGQSRLGVRYADCPRVVAKAVLSAFAALAV